MICYKDMTFCSFYANCLNGKKCQRALTEKVRKDADAFGLGVCEYVNKPGCHIEVHTYYT